MRVFIFALIALMFVGYSFSEAKESNKLAENTIESMDLLKMFALDKSVDYTMYNWATGSEEISPIEWMHEGIKEAPKDNRHVYERKGQVIVLNNGKVTHKLLKKNLVNGKWTITLRGARGGYFEVDIDPDTFTYPEPMLAIDKKYIIEEKHCEESASSNTSMYLIGFKEKKPFWLKENFSSGSGGGSYWYTIQYDKKPKCENTDDASVNQANEFYTYNLFYNKFQAVFPGEPTIQEIPIEQIDPIALEKMIPYKYKKDMSQTQVEKLVANMIIQMKNSQPYIYVDNINQIWYKSQTMPSQMKHENYMYSGIKNTLDNIIKDSLKADDRTLINFSSTLDANNNTYIAIYDSNYFIEGKKVYTSTKHIYYKDSVFKWSVSYLDSKNKKIFDTYEKNVKILNGSMRK